MALIPTIAGGYGPTQATGLQRSAALARILAFENTMHKRLGNTRPIRYWRLFNYYSQQNLPPDNVEQPLQINLFKTICDRHNNYLWGQWNKHIVSFRVRPKRGDKPEDDQSKAIKRWLDDFWDTNERNALLRRGGHDAAVYGDAIFRLRWDRYERRVVVETILPEYVHFRWDPNNIHKITEAIVAYPIDRLDAEEWFGTTGRPEIDFNLINPEYMPGFGIYWEHWTNTTYHRWIDDVLIEQGANPYMKEIDGNLWPGIIPFVHVPNMPISGEFWGFSDGEGMLFMQDELNRRMADMGDTVNNHAHPITTINNFFGDVEDLPVGPDALWNLGKDGKADLLQWKGTPPAVQEYLNTLLKLIYDTTDMPEVAFGRSSRGSGTSKASQGGTSGIALQLAFEPIVEHATDKRIHWDLGIRQINEMAAFIQQVQDPESLGFPYDALRRYEQTVVFANILPRDRMAVVNEQVALVNAILRSRERALEELGEENILSEEKKVWADAKELAKLGLLSRPVPGGKNSDRGNGGSPSNPGGPGANQRKAGSLGKSA